MIVSHAIDVLPLAAGSWAERHAGWLVVALILAVGLLAVGLKDVQQFSMRRTWAISGVCFAESIRKRVLLIAPLAIVAVLIITQLQRAFDEQDALRQTLKVCLFATGLVTVMTAMIIACTNLPKEIESRVIFTIVTKPTTRLELILGKVIGFARVSLTIVAIMGVFTWAYLHVRASEKMGQIGTRLRETAISDSERSRLEHYQSTGLLTARNFALADELAVFARPAPPQSGAHYITGEGDEDVLTPFFMHRSKYFGPEPQDPNEWGLNGIGNYGMVIRVNVLARDTGPAEPAAPPQQSVFGPVLPSKAAPAAPASNLAPQAPLTIQIFDENRFTLYQGRDMIGASTLPELEKRIMEYERGGQQIKTDSASAVPLGPLMKLPDGSEAQFAYAWLPPATAAGLFSHTVFHVDFFSPAPHTEFRVGAHPVSIFIPQPVNGRLVYAGPGAIEAPAVTSKVTGDQVLMFRGRIGMRYEQQLVGGPDHPGEVAIYSFHGSHLPMAIGGRIPLEFSAQIDRTDIYDNPGKEAPTQVDISVADHNSGKVTVLPPLKLESRQTAFISVPASAVTGPDFDIIAHIENNGQTIGLYPASLKLVTSQVPFELNLTKSLLIIWMMSVLVIALSVMCSTFLSWPIAVVLTIVLLLGHWGVNELADTNGPGLGRQIVQDFKLQDVSVSKVVSTSVDELSHGLNLFASVLPDTGQFDAVSDVEEGVSVSLQKLFDALKVLGAFALPAVVIAYLVMKNKEVAP